MFERGDEWHDVGVAGVDVKQVRFVRRRAAVADCFARHDDVEVVVEAALAGRADATARTAAGDDQRVYPLGNEHVEQMRAEKRRGAGLLDQRLSWPPSELRRNCNTV